jgi:hypothetical protein
MCATLSKCVRVHVPLRMTMAKQNRMLLARLGRGSCINCAVVVRMQTEVGEGKLSEGWKKVQLSRRGRVPSVTQNRASWGLPHTDRHPQLDTHDTEPPKKCTSFTVHGHVRISLDLPAFCTDRCHEMLCLITDLFLFHRIAHVLGWRTIQCHIRNKFA